MIPGTETAERAQRINDLCEKILGVLNQEANICEECAAALVAALNIVLEVGLPEENRAEIATRYFKELVAHIRPALSS